MTETLNIFGKELTCPDPQNLGPFGKKIVFRLQCPNNQTLSIIKGQLTNGNMNGEDLWEIAIIENERVVYNNNKLAQFFYDGSHSDDVKGYLKDEEIEKFYKFMGGTWELIPEKYKGELVC